MRLLILTLISFLTANALMGQNTNFEDWNKDGDGVIERHEFITVFADEYFERWDPSDPAGLIEDDFFRETFAGLDSDNDRFLSDEEWMVGYNYFYDEHVKFEDMAAVDIDGDGLVEYNEFYDVIYDTEFFTMIDLDNDNFISEYELANYVFNNWDLNDSGVISKSEYNMFDWYYLDV